MKIGTPIWKRCDRSMWYYWIDGKQGFCNGDVSAVTLLGAKREIRIKHPGCVLNAVLHERYYHR